MKRDGWFTQFPNAIPVPSGRPLRTFADARAFILKLPKANQESQPWQTAIEVLLREANAGVVMMAEIAARMALKNRQPKARPKR